MDVLTVFALYVFSFTTGVFTLRLPLDDTASAVISYVDISEIGSSHDRHKRSPHYLPSSAHITLNIQGANVSLTLRRNFNIDVNLPVYMNINGNIERVELDEIQGAGLYQDRDSGASLLLQRDVGSLETHTKVFGTFYINSQHYAVQPHDSDGAGPQDGVRPSHVVSKVPSQTLLYESTVIPDASTIIDRKRRSEHQRHRRQSDNYKVEVLFVTDYKVYQFWYDGTTGSNRQNQALDKLRQYYAYTLNGMDLRYKSISNMTFVIDILSAGMFISKRYADSPWSENLAQSGNVDSTAILEAIRSWVQDQQGLPDHDHAMGFTGYNVVSMTNGQFASESSGIAYTKSLCGLSSQSIVEDNFSFLSITTAAHELGHSLGSAHDGTGNTCSSNDNYIMAPVNRPDSEPEFGKNLWIFSRCSLQAFQAYIEFLDITNNNCMLRKSPDSTEPKVLPPMADVYSPDQTCVYNQGPGSYVCRSIQNYLTICSAMYCHQPGTSLCYTTIPPDNTPCGQGKWCEMGVCVSSPSARDVPDNCPLGDRQGAVEDGKTCTQLIQELPGRCYGQTMEQECCSSCDAIKTNIQGCEYGDHGDNTFCPTIKRYDCYNAQNENACCESCRALKNEALVGCEYGDKLLGCNKDSCSSYNQQSRTGCCETCYDGPTPTLKPTPTPKPTTPTPKVTTPSAVTTQRPDGTSRPTQSPEVTTPLEESKGPNSVLIGIGAGAGLLVVLVVILVVCMFKRKARKSDTTDAAKLTNKQTGYENNAFTNVETVTEKPQHPPPRRTTGEKVRPVAAIVRPNRPELSAPLHSSSVVPIKPPSHPPPRRSNSQLSRNSPSLKSAHRSENSPNTRRSTSQQDISTKQPSLRKASLQKTPDVLDNRSKPQLHQKRSSSLTPSTDPHNSRKSSLSKTPDFSDSRFKPLLPKNSPRIINKNQSEGRSSPKVPMKIPATKGPDQSDARPKPHVPMKPPSKPTDGTDTRQNEITNYTDGYMTPKSVRDSTDNISVHYTVPHKPKLFEDSSSTPCQNSEVPRATQRPTKTVHYRKPTALTKSIENVGRKMSNPYDSIGEIQNMLCSSDAHRNGHCNEVRPFERRPTLPANHPKERISHASVGDGRGRSDAYNVRSYESSLPLVPRNNYQDGPQYQATDAHVVRPRQVSMTIEPPKPKPRFFSTNFLRRKTDSTNISNFNTTHSGNYGIQNESEKEIINIPQKDASCRHDFNDLRDTYDQPDPPRRRGLRSDTSVGLNKLTTQTNDNSAREPTAYSSIDKLEIHI